jgi:signal transduction histidine kinase
LGAIVILLLEDSDLEAERIFVALSEGGPECSVRRARTGEGLASILTEGPVDLIVAGGAAPGLDVGAILEVARARFPAVPLVVVARDPRVAEAAELLVEGAAAYVRRDRLDGLGAAVGRALEGAALREGRRRAEAALREAIAAGHRKDELLMRVAHELRTPLNAMLGWASMLRTRRLDEAARARALETIERNARAEARLIEDLLDVSRMLTGTLRLDVMEVELCPAVAAVIEAARPAADAKEIVLAAALDDTAGSVAGDPVRLRQVVSELCANALRATARGGRVCVQLARRGADAELTVSDTGRGIRAECLPDLFDGFSRAGASTHGRLGVGLRLARHLVEAHGGAITAASPGEGRGAIFTVRLPRLHAGWSEHPPHRDGDARDPSARSGDLP